MKRLKNFALIACAMLAGFVGSSVAGMVSVQYFTQPALMEPTLTPMATLASGIWAHHQHPHQPRKVQK